MDSVPETLVGLPIYECHCCDFETKLKSEFNDHINTPEHQENECNYCPEIVKDRLTLLEERVAKLENQI